MLWVFSQNKSKSGWKIQQHSLVWIFSKMVPNFMILEGIFETFVTQHTNAGARKFIYFGIY